MSANFIIPNIISALLISSLEMISKFIYEKLKEKISIVSKVSVWETPTSCASYYEEV